MFDEFITIFLEDSPTLLGEIRNGLTSNDASAVEKGARSLKGLTANFGAKECVELALKLQLADRAGSVDGCEKDFEKLESLQSQLLVQLRNLHQESGEV